MQPGRKKIPADKILDAWATGKSRRWIEGHITRDTGQSYTQSAISKCIQAARKAGDPRATYAKLRKKIMDRYPIMLDHLAE